jgi:hypothetical protein
MKFGNFEQKRPSASSPKQESAPGSSQSPLDQWVNQSRHIIDAIDHNHQLEETEPGVRFSQDLAMLLDKNVVHSPEQLSELFHNLYQDLIDHDFLMAYNEDADEFHIHMAHETAPAELGTLFKQFSGVLQNLPIPGDDPLMTQKRDLLMTAFNDRSKQLLGQ